MIFSDGHQTDATRMIKYGFRIRTRSGTVVDNLVFAARDPAEAERTVMQIYHHCEILECVELQPALREEGFDLVSAINLIGRETGTDKPDKS